MAKVIKLLVASIVTITASAFYFHSSELFSSRSPIDTQGVPKLQSHPESINMPWNPTRSKEALDAQTLLDGSPRMAKDADFANAVVTAWNAEEADRRDHRAATASETTLFEYKDSSDGATLYGHLIRRTEGNGDAKVPGILLFHTGAGPHDVFLQWKADSLASNKEIFPDGCVVLVTDVLSDDTGWGWSDDRTKYNQARTKVLKGDNSGERLLLQSRIRAALSALQEFSPDLDMTRLCALGWCLGGHGVLELGRMQIPGMKAMITFHGVFDGVPPPPKQSTSDVPTNEGAEILICHGDLDPFVDKETVLANAIKTLQQLGHNVRLMNLEGAKHGFTNPAQDYNTNAAFGYNDNAANTSWSETLSLLKRVLA